MLAFLREQRYPVEAALLLLLAASLPLFEAPKNLAWAGYAAAWLWNRAQARDFGGRWDAWDSLIAVWIASGYVVAAFAPVPLDEWKGANDLLRYGSILWMVKRGGYGERLLLWVAGAVVASTLASLALGWWMYARMVESGRPGELQLKSVGHVNHSAIYLAIVAGLCAAWTFARWRAWGAGVRVGALALLAAFAVSLVAMGSRGAVAVAAALVLVLALAWWPRWRAPLYAGVAALALGVALVLAIAPDMIVKHRANVASDNVLAFRDGIWRMGLAAWERHPWTGVGMSNYSSISIARVAEWRAQAGQAFDPSRYVGTSHAHSLYVNTLAERGLAGALPLGALLLAWAWGLARRRPSPQEGDARWLLWGAALSAWFVTVLVGVVNTTLHHEHGILAMLFLGAWLSSLPRRAS